MSIRILRGPFRGARVVMNPRNSPRKIFGLYEHELNEWLELALDRVHRVLDIGANDGYFTFGCGSAFQRRGKSGEIIAVEAQDKCVRELNASVKIQKNKSINYTIIHSFASNVNKPGMLTLDSIKCSLNNPTDRSNTLIKIDVEGAELDVIEGGYSWLQPSNLFLIEVHEERFWEQLQSTFAKRGLRLIRVNQRPLKFIGRDNRHEKNWWLVSEILLG